MERVHCSGRGWQAHDVGSADGALERHAAASSTGMPLALAVRVCGTQLRGFSSPLSTWQAGAEPAAPLARPRLRCYLHEAAHATLRAARWAPACPALLGGPRVAARCGRQLAQRHPHAHADALANVHAVCAVAGLRRRRPGPVLPRGLRLPLPGGVLWGERGADGAHVQRRVQRGARLWLRCWIHVCSRRAVPCGVLLPWRQSRARDALRHARQLRQRGAHGRAAVRV